MKKLARIAGLAVVGTSLLAGSGFAGWRWWTVGRFLESTDDAYLQADYTTVAPKVSGYVAAVLVADNQRVRAGQVLARIDDRDFRVALARTKAEVAVARDALRALDAEVTLQHSAIDQARADIDAADAARDFARHDFARYRDLARTNYVARQKLEEAETTLRAREARVRRDRAALVGAKQRLAVFSAERVKAKSELDRASTVERRAELDLGYTTIVAPIAGTVGARKLRVGQYVQAGTALMAVVPLDRVYVVANFKETQLTNVRPGQRATVAVDAFPGVRIPGHVDSISPASGLEFALLPPDNATGNFTKIVQRVPAKIVLDRGSPLLGLLRPGMSVEPTVDTRSSTGDGAPAAPGPVAANDLPARD